VAVIARAARPRTGFAALDFAAPAFVVSVAYVDPGNFATNVAAGATCGYTLLWVVVIASATAMFFQTLSSKLGLVTGKSLATHVRESWPPVAAVSAWIVSEMSAMATEIAEVLGAALAFHLLLGVSLLAGALLTFGVVGAILAAQRLSFRPHETLVIAMVGVVCVAYVVETVMAQPAWGDVLRGSAVPWLGSADALTLAVAIVGATVMPHALYYHSSLTQERVESGGAWLDRRSALKRSTVGVVVALTIAGLVNLAMMYVSASTFHAHGAGVVDLGQAYRGLTPLLGRNAALVFGIALLASGLSSSVVGTSAGQAIVQDYIGRRIPLWIRRIVTILPALAVVALGCDVMKTLIVSQVVLSLVLPVPLIALVWFTSSRGRMGSFVNGRLTTAIAVAGTAFVIALDAFLIRALV